MFYFVMYFIFLNARVEPLGFVRNKGAHGIKVLVVTIKSYINEFMRDFELHFFSF